VDVEVEEDKDEFENGDADEDELEEDDDDENGFVVSESRSSKRDVNDFDLRFSSIFLMCFFGTVHVGTVQSST